MSGFAAWLALALAAGSGAPEGKTHPACQASPEILAMIESVVPDSDLAQRHRTAFLDLCPRAHEIGQRLQSLHVTQPVLARKVAASVRAGVATRADWAVDLLPSVWEIEFRVLPVEEHAAVRERVAQDLVRLRKLRRPEDARWLETLLVGYRMLDDDAGMAWVTERCVEFHRDRPFTIRLVMERWRVAHPWPGNLAGPAVLEAFQRELLKATESWIELWPEDALAWHERFGALSKLNDTPSEALVQTGERVLALLEKKRTFWTHPPVPILIAKTFVDRGVALARVETLVEQGQREIEAEAGKQLEADSTRAREIEESAEWERSQGRAVLFDALVALGRLDEAQVVLEEMRRALELHAPAAEAPFAERQVHEGQRASWWRRSADLARAQGRSLDALLSLQTALAHDPSSVELSQRAALHWRELGGSMEAWESWLADDAGRSFAVESSLTSKLWEMEPRPLPDLALPDLAGRTWHRADLEGRVTLVVVWATWCGPCLAELPEVQKLHERVADRKDVAVLTLNVDENVGLVAPLVARRGFTFPVLLAREYVEGILGELSIPRSWIVDHKGTLRKEQEGFRAGDLAWGDGVLALLEEIAAESSTP